jgi:hypothetical protein
MKFDNLSALDERIREVGISRYELLAKQSIYEFRTPGTFKSFLHVQCSSGDSNIEQEEDRQP